MPSSVQAVRAGRCRKRLNSCGPLLFGPQEKEIEVFTPARSRRILRPGRIEHMSTQRRAHCMNRTRAQIAPDTRISIAVAGVRIAPPGATESLSQDPRFVPLVSHTHPSLKKAGPRATHRYSSPLISIPSGSPKSHPASPQAPAVSCRRAERHDGKGNLYLQYAA